MAVIDLSASIGLEGLTAKVAGLGYIGRQMVRQGLHKGMHIFAHDPEYNGIFDCQPNFCHLDRGAFLAQIADISYFALHPGHREEYLSSAPTSPVELWEKPLLRARDSENLDAILQTFDQRDADIYFNFVLANHPITMFLVDYFRQYKEVKLEKIGFYIEKDRETPNPDREWSPMETVEFQEMVHMIAALLTIEGNILRNPLPRFNNLFPDGLSITGESRPYDIPDPNDPFYDIIPNAYSKVNMKTDGFEADLMVNFKKLSLDLKPTRTHKTMYLQCNCDGKLVKIAVEYEKAQEAIYVVEDGISTPKWWDSLQPYGYVWHHIYNLHQQARNEEPLSTIILPNHHLAAECCRWSGIFWAASDQGSINITSQKQFESLVHSYAKAYRAGRLPKNPVFVRN